MNKRPDINKTFSIGTNNSDVNRKIHRLRTAGLGLFLAVGILLATGTSAVASTSPSNELTTFGGPSDDTASSARTNSAYSVTVDSAGNVYTAGSLIDLVYFGSGDNVVELDRVGARDAYISKTDSSGNLVWVKRFGGKIMRAFSITVDPLGNIYTGGYFAGPTDFDPGVNEFMRGSRNRHNRDGFVSKFDPDGNLIWARTFGGSVDDYVASVVATPSGHVYITGMFGGTARFGSTPFNLPGGDYDRDYLDTTGFDWFIAKLDSDGELVWVEALGGSESPWEPGEATSTKPNGGLVVDAAGNPYITGYFSGTAHFGADDSATTITSVGDQDIFLAKFDSAGSLTWVQSAGGNNSDEGHSVATYGVDHVYTVGQMELSGGFILASHTMVDTDGDGEIDDDDPAPSDPDDSNVARAAAGITITHTGGSTTVDEHGAADTFNVVLASDPGEGNTVVVDVTSVDETEVIVDLAQLIFTGGPDGTWDEAQTVTVTGVADATVDADETVIITAAVNVAGTESGAYDNADNDNATIAVTNTNVDTTPVDTTPGGTVNGSSKRSMVICRLTNSPSSNWPVT